MKMEKQRKDHINNRGRDGNIIKSSSFRYLARAKEKMKLIKN